MNSSNMEVSEIHGRLSPAAEEAAVKYANGDSGEAEAILSRAVSEPTTGQDARLSWLMLFELYRLQGRWNEFDRLGKRYRATFGKPAPDWIIDEDLPENLPAPLRRGGAGYCPVSGELSGSAEELSAIRRAAAEQSVIHIDFARLERVAPAGCEALSTEFQFLITNGNGVYFSGAEGLEKLVRRAVDATPKTAAYWRLLLDLYQLQGRRKQFENAAVEYALFCEIDPPAWEPVLMPVLPQTTGVERRDEPRYSQGAEVIFLQGEMTGPNDPELAAIRRFAHERQYVNINMSKLARIDFVCAANFGNTVLAFADLGKTVRVIRPNLLVATLLRLLKVDEHCVFVSVGLPA
ncbi:MAG TPA: hypothetical protein VFB20_04815 [Burkholderiales bacterium]|nr:hypothetical protein [Burkholderiales bacterium]